LKSLSASDQQNDVSKNQPDTMPSGCQSMIISTPANQKASVSDLLAAIQRKNKGDRPSNAHDVVQDMNNSDDIDILNGNFWQLVLFLNYYYYYYFVHSEIFLICLELIFVVFSGTVDAGGDATTFPSESAPLSLDENRVDRPKVSSSEARRPQQSGLGLRTP